MDIQRRDFFRNLGSKSAGLAAGAVAPALVHMNSFADELKALSQELNKKLAQSKIEFANQYQALNNRFDGITITMTYQQIQIYFIFLLLLLSFAIDAGMTGIWLLS